MTLKQILTFDLRGMLHWDGNRMPRDVGKVVTIPLKVLCGWLIGAAVLALATIVREVEPSESVARSWGWRSAPPKQ
jgi:hypothetical protein